MAKPRKPKLKKIPKKPKLTASAATMERWLDKKDSIQKENRERIKQYEKDLKKWEKLRKEIQSATRDKL